MSGLEPIWTFPLLLRRSIDFNKSFTILKTLFVKLYKDSILSAKSDNVLSTSISDNLEQ